MSAATTTGIEYLDVYLEMLDHQRRHGGLMPGLPGEPEQPSQSCFTCAEAGARGPAFHELQRRYAWAVPSPEALDAIARHSPGGVVEIGAGSGYWAMLLQRRGVDVLAYDPEPGGGPSDWHEGRAWTAVHQGDDTQAADHPTRTLLVCWPSYDRSWAAQALECYGGDTVIYIGEGEGGCTADDRFHALVGEHSGCWHHDDDGEEVPCPPDCASGLTPLFAQVEGVSIPQWWGLHDRLRVYRRVRGEFDDAAGNRLSSTRPA